MKTQIDESNWIDITNEFIGAAKTLKIGDLVTSPEFNLFSGVQSLEVCIILDFKYKEIPIEPV